MAKKMKHDEALKRIEILEAELAAEKRANERVKTLESKLALIEEAVERSLSSGKLSKTTENKTTITSAPLPTDIVVSKKDKLNTSPTNGIRKGFFSNSRLYFAEMTQTLIKSKMFWILLVILPMLLTLIDYSIFVSFGSARIEFTQYLNGEGVTQNVINYKAAGFGSISLDMINYFVMSPLLLTSLIIFPSYIAKSRENNTLKRQAMIGVTRKQTYYYYTFFSILFVVVFALFWFGPWTMLLDFVVKNIFVDLTPITGNGFGAASTSSYKSLTIILGWGDNLPSLINDKIMIPDGSTPEEIINMIFNVDGWQEYLKGDKSQLTNLVSALTVIKANGLDDIALLNTEFAKLVGDVDALLYPPLFEVFEVFDNLVPMIVVLAIAIVTLNNYGYKKAMKAKSSSGMLGWGIGMWIFATFASSGSVLMGINVIQSTWSSQPFWNIFLMVILFVSKWMFVFTLPSLLMSSVMIAGLGLTDYSNMMFDPESELVVFDAQFVHNLQIAIIAITVIISLILCITVFFNKTKIMSYEASR